MPAIISPSTAGCPPRVKAQPTAEETLKDNSQLKDKTAKSGAGIVDEGLGDNCRE